MSTQHDYARLIEDAESKRDARLASIRENLIPPEHTSLLFKNHGPTGEETEAQRLSRGYNDSERFQFSWYEQLEYLDAIGEHEECWNRAQELLAMPTLNPGTKVDTLHLISCQADFWLAKAYLDTAHDILLLYKDQSACAHKLFGINWEMQRDLRVYRETNQRIAAFQAGQEIVLPFRPA